MATIIEPGGDSGGTAVIAVFVGIIAAAIIGMFALGVFEPHNPNTAEIKVEAPATPTTPAPEPGRPN